MRHTGDDDSSEINLLRMANTRHINLTVKINGQADKKKRVQIARRSLANVDTLMDVLAEELAIKRNSNSCIYSF